MRCWVSKWTWDGRDENGSVVALGKYRTRAAVQWSDGDSVPSSNVLVDEKQRVTRRRFGTVKKIGAKFSDKWCDPQQFGNCLFSKYFPDYLITATWARGYATYKLVLPRNAKLIGKSVRWIIGTYGSVKWSKSGRVVTALIVADGRNGQRQAYIGSVKARYSKTYEVTEWSVVR
jgi:hypothetical protein